MVEKLKENSSDWFFGNISNALNYLKNKLIPQKSPDSNKENLVAKVQQESGKDRINLKNFQKEILLINEKKREAKSELFWLHEKIVPNKKNISQKNAPFQYTPTHMESANWLQNNQDKRVAAPWIAQSADDLRNDIKWSPILNYFLG